jgi:hypothetical protein
METKYRLMQSLLIGGFKLIPFCLILLSACVKPIFSGSADYSLINHLNEDVDLYLYVSDEEFKMNVQNLYIIPHGEKVVLMSKQSTSSNRHGLDLDAIHFVSFIDSVKVFVKGQENEIIKWSKDGENYFEIGYESVKDFYDTENWSGSPSTGENYIEWSFALSIIQ